MFHFTTHTQNVSAVRRNHPLTERFDTNRLQVPAAELDGRAGASAPAVYDYNEEESDESDEDGDFPGNDNYA